MNILIGSILTIFGFIGAIVFNAHLAYYKIDNFKIVTVFWKVFHLITGYVFPIGGIIFLRIELPLSKDFVILIALNFLIIILSIILYIIKAQNKIQREINNSSIDFIKEMTKDNEIIFNNLLDHSRAVTTSLLHYQLKVCELLNHSLPLVNSITGKEDNKQVELDALLEIIKSEIKGINKE